MPNAEESMPVSLRLTTPGSWLHIDLDPRTRSGSLARLVGDRLGDPASDDPERAILRRDLTAMLRGFARDAAAAGAVYAAMLLENVDGAPLQVSLIASYATVPEGGSVAAALAAPAGSVVQHQLPLGAGIRLVAKTEIPASTIGSDDESAGTQALQVQYGVPVPGQASALVLSFSSPQVANDDALLELFDAIAADARWIYP
jgi:hypothetical protein